MNKDVIIASIAVICFSIELTLASTQEPPPPDLLQQLLDKHSSELASAGTQRGDQKSKQSEDAGGIFNIVQNVCGEVVFARSPNLPVYVVWSSSKFTLRWDDLGQPDDTVQLMVNGTVVDTEENFADISLPVAGSVIDWMLLQPDNKPLLGRIKRLSQVDFDTVKKKLGPKPATEKSFTAADHYAVLSIYAEYGLYLQLYNYVKKRKTLMRDEQFRNLACAALFELVDEK